METQAGCESFEDHPVSTGEKGSTCGNGKQVLGPGALRVYQGAGLFSALVILIA